MAPAHSRPHAIARAMAAVSVVLLAAMAGCAAGPAPPDDDVAERVDEVIDVFIETADRKDDLRAVLVIRGGEVLVERYLDATPDDWFELRSITKSVTSTLVGIAIDEGYIGGTDATLGELLPSYAASLSAEMSAITLHEVLTHTAGFAPGNVPGELEYWMTPDWTQTILDDRAERGPGDGAFAYSNAGSHVLATILAESTGMPVLAFAREHLFDPLGIPTDPVWDEVLAGTDAELDAILEEYSAAEFAWAADPQGTHEGASSLKLRPEDLAALGMLIAQDGQWRGEQIVSREWVQEATSPLTSTDFGPVPSYGYQWWVTEDATTSCGVGAGGQVLCIHPQSDVVVVVASSIDLFDETRLINGMSAERALTFALLIVGVVE